jgi:hypothetical protein
VIGSEAVMSITRGFAWFLVLVLVDRSSGRCRMSEWDSFVEGGLVVFDAEVDDEDEDEEE